MKLSHADMRWNELMDEYFFCRSVRVATEWSYRKVLNGFRKFVGETLLPEDIRQQHVREWRREVLKKQNRSTHTWNNKVRHMRAIFNFACSSTLLNLSENPFDGMNVRQEKKRKKTLTKKQVKRILLILEQFHEEEKRSDGVHWRSCAIRPAWYWMIVVNTLCFTGMRLNQLLHLRLRDVNLDERWIDLCSEGSKTHHEWRIPMVSHLVPGMRHLIDEAMKRGAGPEDYLFHYHRYVALMSEAPFVTGLPELQPVKGFFRRLTKECGFPVSPHRFRHTLASTLMSAPERNLYMVKTMLGHRNVSTTLEYVEIDLKGTARVLEKELAELTDVF